VSQRLLSALAASICAVSVALGAYASHAAAGQARERLALAALFAFGHGLALLVLAARTSALAQAARLAMLAGIVLFSGGLAAAGLWATPTAAAPFGGSLLIVAWVLAAIDYARVP
jgi:uncharacterized membrane protein YgdD (TMEM256/DUF423 family)